MTKKTKTRKTLEVPKDELALAAALAAANARGMKFAECYEFVDSAGLLTYPGNAAGCCAFGALKLAGVVPLNAKISRGNGAFQDAWMGNDANNDPWDTDDDDKGQSLGYAYRCAMKEPA